LPYAKSILGVGFVYSSNLGCLMKRRTILRNNLYCQSEDWEVLIT
jgi:hypothetical protein